MEFLYILSLVCLFSVHGVTGSRLNPGGSSLPTKRDDVQYPWHDISKDGPCRPILETKCRHVLSVKTSNGPAPVPLDKDRGAISPLDMVVSKVSSRYNLSITAADLPIMSRAFPIAQCLETIVRSEERHHLPAASSQLGDACKAELWEHSLARSSDIRQDPAILAACIQEIHDYCLFGEDTSFVFTCLKQHKHKATEGCKSPITFRQMEAAAHLELDPPFQRACQEDLVRHCSGASKAVGEGKSCLSLVQLQHYLERSGNPSPLSASCDKALTLRLMEDAEDFRLNYYLMNSCRTELHQYCREFLVKGWAALDCLDQQRESQMFAAECDMGINTAMMVRSIDPRYDYWLRVKCEDTVATLCGEDQKEALNDPSLPLGSLVPVTECLRSKRAAITDIPCREHIHDVIRAAYLAPQHDAMLLEVCRIPIKQHCPVSFTTLDCLVDKLRSGASLPSACQQLVKERVLDLSEEVNLLAGFLKRCQQDKTSLCGMSTLGEQEDVINCLLDLRAHKDTRPTCKATLDRAVVSEAAAILLYQQLVAACSTENDLMLSCPPIDHRGPQLLRCWYQNRKMMTTSVCRSQLLRVLGLPLMTSRVSLQLKASCEEELRKYCVGVPPEGQFDCLSLHESVVSGGCALSLVKVEELLEENLGLHPTLGRACESVIQEDCHAYRGSPGKIAGCLLNTQELTPLGPCGDAIKKLEEVSIPTNVSASPGENECAEDVIKHCPQVGSSAESGSWQESCLVEHHTDLEPGCRKSLEARVHQQLNRYRVGANLTAICDEELLNKCHVGNHSVLLMAEGFAFHCLLSHHASLSPKCWQLVTIPVHVHDSRGFFGELLLDQGADCMALWAEVTTIPVESGEVRSSRAVGSSGRGSKGSWREAMKGVSQHLVNSKKVKEELYGPDHTEI